MPDRLTTLLHQLLEETAAVQNQATMLSAIAEAMHQLDHAGRMALDDAAGTRLMGLLLEVEHRYHNG